MRKIFLSLSLVFLMLCISSLCAAQEQEEELSLPQQLSLLLFRDHFNLEDGHPHYYRFPTLRTLYDPLDLSYFPHEKQWEWDWSLLRRNNHSGIYEQMIMLSKPAEGLVIQGTGIGKEYGFLGDFYLYATLFVADTYPADSGSCYIYFSDSLVRSDRTGHGILIDPASGIYKADNAYKTYYETSTSKYKLTLLKELTPEDYPFPDDIVLSTHSAAEFDAAVDEAFLDDYNLMNTSYRMMGSPAVKAYRIEIIRTGFYTDIFINGKRAVHMLDFITKTDEDGNEVPNMVSWSYGPILYKGGTTVTCAAGDLYIYGSKSEREKIHITFPEPDEDAPK